MTYKHTLVLGGIYLIICLFFGYVETPVNYYADWLFMLLFIYFNIRLFMNKKIGFIEAIFEHHPNWRQYLIIVGWIPYVGIFSELIVVVISLFSGEAIRDQFYEISSYLTVACTIGLTVVQTVRLLVQEHRRAVLNAEE